MFSRRTFLGCGSLTLAALACVDTTAASQNGPLNRPIGLQIYSVRDEAAKSMARTLQVVADIGYREIELAGIPPVSAHEMRNMLAERGLSAPSLHASMSDLRGALQRHLDYANTVGANYVVCSFPSTADLRFADAAGDEGNELAAGISRQDWIWNAEQLNAIGRVANGAGLRFGYHNHNMEFRSYGGVVAYDELLRLTDPALVTMELDIGWVVSAGADPLHYLRRHADRISMLHLKEVRKGFRHSLDNLAPRTTELGRGVIDWRTLFAAMSPNLIQHYFVEQENFDGSSLDAVKVSYDYLTGLGA